MADEKKLSESSSVSEWIKGYYGFDGLDYPKVEKIRHVERVAQFSSVCYVIGKNSKKAHTDLFDSNYTASSIKVSKSAELIIKLLEMRTKDGGMHRLTKKDFNDAGGEKLFATKDRPVDSQEYNQIVEDYIGDGGMVDICQTLFPIKTDNALNAKMFKGLTDNMDIIQKDHSQLLTIATDGKQTSLPLKDILGMRYKIAECASGKWNEKKDKKSALQAELMKIKEELYESKRNLAIKGGKVAMLGGAAAMSIGAVIGGTFWPALLLIPIYSAGKSWFTDLSKAFGNTWGNLEKQRKVKREIKWLEAQLEYLTQWKVHGTDPRKHKSWMKRSQWRRLRGIDLDNLKKQGKLMQEAVTTEITYYDPVEKKWKEKVQKSAVEETFDAIAQGAGVVSDVMEVDNLAPIDLKEYLKKSIEKLDPNKATYEEFLGVAGDINKYIEKIPSSAQDEIQSKYAEKLEQSAKHLVFGTEMKTLTDYQHRTAKYLADDSAIFKPIKELRPDIVENVKGYSTLVGKELTGLSSDYIGKSMEDFIMRTPEPNNTSFELSSPELSLVAGDTKFNNPADVHLVTAINAIADLKVSKADENKFIGSGFSVERLNQEIAQIADSDDKEQCDKLLKDQMRRVAYEKAREDSRVTYDALLHGELGGKLDFNELFKKIGEVTYDNIDTYSAFYEDTKKMEPKQVGAYIRTKLRKSVYDVMLAYANNNRQKFKNDLKELSTYLKKVNACTYLDEKQKLDLSSAVSGYVADAFGNKYTDLTETFMQDNGYNTNEFSDYLKSYEFGGFKELFDSDQSASTQILRDNIVYMRDLQDVYKSLKLNEQFDLNKDEAKYIAESLLSDRSTGNKPIIRGNNDPLRKFITQNIKNMDTSFGTDVDKDSITNKQPYKDLVSALNEIKSMSTSSVKDCYDQYTALIILKNKCTSLFRLCMKEYIQGHFSGSRSTWIDTNSASINEVKNVWKNGIMKDIDDTFDAQLAYYMGKDPKFAKGSVTTARSELSKYGVGSEVEKMLTERQL